MTRNLSQLRPGEKAFIASVEGQHRQRLMELGFVPGTLVTMRLRVPAGDPMEVGVRQCAMMLRRADAASVLLK